MTARLLPAFLCLLSIIPLHAQTAPEITAKSAILVDANTGKVLFSKNDTTQRAVASTQKLLTALIVAEAGDLDKRVEIEPTDTNCEPTKIYVKPGQSYTRASFTMRGSAVSTPSTSVQICTSSASSAAPRMAAE